MCASAGIEAAFRPNLGEQVAVALGGNAETLANVAPGPRQQDFQRLKFHFCASDCPTFWSATFDSA